MNRRARVLVIAAALGIGSAAQAAHPVRPVGAPEPVDAGPPPEAAKPAEPEPAPAKGPVAPQKKAEPAKKPVAPTTLPPELQPKAPVVEKKIENPAEVTYRQKVVDHAFALRVRPGAPKPGDTLELILELSKLHDPPDPVVGDREPARDEDLVLTLEKGKTASARVMHELPAPGQYGAHVSTSEAGMYTVRISRRSGKPGVDASFPLGVGVATPVRPDDVSATLSPTGRGPVSGQDDGSSATKNTLAKLMRDLGEKLLAADAAFAGRGEVSANIKAMDQLAKAIPGQTPPHNENRPREFDQQAQELDSLLSALAVNPNAAKLADVEQNHCIKCHAEFRWGVASDVSAWPSFTAAKEIK